MLPDCSKTLSKLPPYLFVKLNAVKDEAARKGLDVIDLGQGNPDHPAPPHVVDALCRSVREDATTHRYPNTKGIRRFREAVASWYNRRFGVALDPDREVLPLIGSKEGLAHLLFAYLGPSDLALIPSPCYPVHYNAALLTGAKLHLVPLTEENKFLPDLSKIPASAARKAKVLLANYPNNPTGAVADLPFFERCLHFARKNGILMVHDNPYSEITFDGWKAPSFLQVPGAIKQGVEFHSCTKSFSMAGWRVGFAVGNAATLANLYKFKGFVDYGTPNFIQEAAAAALTGPQDYVVQMANLYQERRDVLVRSFAAAGWPVPSSPATLYVWARVPEPFRKKGSFAFAEQLLLQEGVVVAPGVGFGPLGEGWVRIALVEEAARIEDAARRIGRFLQSRAAARGGSRKESTLAGR